MIDIFLFSFFKGSKEITDFRFKQAKKIITTVTEQAMQVEVEKIIYFKKRKKGYRIYSRGNAILNLNKNYMYIQYKV